MSTDRYQKRQQNQGQQDRKKKAGKMMTRTKRQTIGTGKEKRKREKTITLDEYYASWIKRRKATARKQSTPLRYDSWYRKHIRRDLGRMRIREIHRPDVLALQTGMVSEGYLPGTVNCIIQLLKAILNDAVADEIIDRNPAYRVRSLKEENVAGETYHRALTEDEQNRFLSAARSSFYYELFAFLLLTGMRHGEAAAMTWEDVDWEKNILHVRKSLTLDAQGHVIIGTPKSAAGIRDIPMNESIRRVLREQMRKGRKNVLSDADFLKHRIFYARKNPDGILQNPTANNALRRVLRRMKEAGDPVRDFSLHALRDTFATRFIEQGGNPQTLKTLLGHSSLAMTMDLYSHVMPNTKQKEMDQMNIPV